jgi:hypothetical protein
MSETEKHNIPADQFLKMVPSSAAKPKLIEPQARRYQMSVQRLQDNRWRELGRWTVVTTESDMIGPLRAGLKDNYRIIISERTDDPAQEPADEH